MQRRQHESTGGPTRAARGRHENGIQIDKEDSGSVVTRTSLRHSVDMAIPDGSIASLYPLEDNYVNEPDGTRSPKNLSELATNVLCRSLPNLNGVLPVGLPQDVVDDILQSLIRHSALNATTLRILRNCELGVLSLSGCRGVTDEWLEALSAESSDSPPHLVPSENCDTADSMDLEGARKPYEALSSNEHSERCGQTFSSCSSSSYASARSTSYPFLEEDFNITNSPSIPNSVLGNKKRTALMWHPCAASSALTNTTLLDLRGSQRLTDRGLMQLHDLGRLEVAKLDNCHSVVGRGLVVLSSSPRLHTLSLTNCRRLTDEAIVNISHLQSLQALSLDGCRCITDFSLAALADMYNLRKLGLSQCDLITNEGLKALEHLQRLQEISLGWCRQVSDAGIQTLTAQPGRSSNLQILRLARCPITDEGVQYLGGLAALEELDLNGCCRISSAPLGKALEKMLCLTVLDVSHCPGILRSDWQGKIRNVKTLELCYSAVKDIHLTKLVNLPMLEELNLDSCPIGDLAIQHFANHNVLPNLVSLDLADSDISDLGMVQIAKFTKLKRLSLFYCSISNRGLRHLSILTELRVLNLDSRDISDDGLRHLQHLKQLKSLDIFSGRVTDLGCTYLSKIKTLESLELCGGGVRDAGCASLAKLENLTSLNLSQNERITNRGAAALAALSKLKALNLSHTRVNASALRYFSGLMNLQSLALYGCLGVDNTYTLDQFQSSLPRLKCVRLHSALEEDGMVIADEEDDELAWNDGEQDEVMEEHDDDDNEVGYSDHD